MQVLEVFHDAFGKNCQEMFELKTCEKKPQPVSMLNKPPVVVEDVRLQKIDPTLSKRLEETKLSSDKVNSFILN